MPSVKARSRMMQRMFRKEWIEGFFVCLFVFCLLEHRLHGGGEEAGKAAGARCWQAVMLGSACWVYPDMVVTIRRCLHWAWVRERHNGSGRAVTSASVWKVVRLRSPMCQSSEVSSLMPE